MLRTSLLPIKICKAHQVGSGNSLRSYDACCLKFFIQSWWFNISSSISKESRTRKLLRHATFVASKVPPFKYKNRFEDFGHCWKQRLGHGKQNRSNNGTKMMIQWPDEGFFIRLAPASIAINNHFHYCRPSLFNFSWFFRFLIFLPRLTFVAGENSSGNLNSDRIFIIQIFFFKNILKKM